MIDNKIVIAITHGDINGIGYEVILKTLSEPRVYDDFVPVIYGSSKALGYYRKMFDIQNLALNVANTIDDIQHKKINIINCGDDELRVEPGKVTDEAGMVAYEALRRATDDMKSGKIDALVTAPINKKNIQSEAFSFPGHTEYLEGLFGKKDRSLMLMVNDVMRVAVVTGHVPVRAVADNISTELIMEKLRTFNHSLKQDFTIIRPRIAVLGLNPHAGDEGVIGSEEMQIIQPALEQAKKEGILVFGPYPADGFFGSGQFKQFDGILAMYHDQGLIPFKTIAMDSGVNFTAGLSIVRTSPAHGTAYDIAGQNTASEASFREALFKAYDIVKNRAMEEDIRSNPLLIQERKERGGRIE